MVLREAYFGALSSPALLFLVLIAVPLTSSEGGPVTAPLDPTPSLPSFDLPAFDLLNRSHSHSRSHSRNRRHAVESTGAQEREPPIHRLRQRNLSIARRSRQPLNAPRINDWTISRDNPIYILFPLPKEKGDPVKNPFGITIANAKPVVDVAVEDVYRRELITPGALNISFADTKLSDAHGPNVAIHALVKNQLDCIIGYVFVYALAPVARMSPFWEDSNSHGIPVITSTGLTASLDTREEYQLMTRISSPYKVVTAAVVSLFNLFGWRRTTYIFHDKRFASSSHTIPYGECYLMMASLTIGLSDFYSTQHNYFMFNEAKYNKSAMYDHLKKASAIGNGWFAFFLI